MRGDVDNSFGLMQLTWTPEIPDQEASFKAMK